MPSPIRSSKRRGYTLIELLLVIGLLGLAAAIVSPQISNQGEMEAQAAVRLVIGDLSYAQADALANQEFRRVHFYADGSGYCLTRVTEDEIGDTFDDATADYLINPFKNMANAPYVVDLVGGGDFKKISVGEVSVDDSRDVYFDPLGGTVVSGGPGTGGTIQVGAEDELYQINVLPFTGKLTVQKVVVP